MIIIIIIIYKSLKKIRVATVRVLKCGKYMNDQSLNSMSTYINVNIPLEPLRFAFKPSFFLCKYLIWPAN